MNISTELLSSYAEGNVSEQEREQVREYLMEKPAELESVMSMMDDDYELEPTSEHLEDIVFGDEIIKNDVICEDSDDSLFDSSVFGGISLCSSTFAPAFQRAFRGRVFSHRNNGKQKKMSSLPNVVSSKHLEDTFTKRMDELLESLD